MASPGNQHCGNCIVTLSFLLQAAEDGTQKQSIMDDDDDDDDVDECCIFKTHSWTIQK